MATTQLLLVNNHTSASGVCQKRTTPTLNFAVQDLLRLCNSVATHYSQSKVMLIIQSPSSTGDIEAEKNASEVCLEQGMTRNVSIDCLKHSNFNEDNLSESFVSRPRVSDHASISLDDIEPDCEDDHIEQHQHILTDREMEILRCIARGKSNKTIAYILGISEQTVKTHVSSILRKLHANDRAHSVALALSNGFS